MIKENFIILSTGFVTVACLSMFTIYKIDQVETGFTKKLHSISAQSSASDSNLREYLVNELLSKTKTMNQEIDSIDAKLDTIDRVIDSDKKRKIRIAKVISAVKATTKFKNPHKGCKDYPTTGELYRIGAAVVDMADRYAVDAALILAITRQESAFCNEAISPVGAQGYMQLMPSTASYVADNVGLPLKTWRGRDNIHLGTAYISQMISEFEGDLGLAVRAYNNGPHNVKKVLKGIRKDYPEETRNYVVRVLEFKEQYEAMGVN